MVAPKSKEGTSLDLIPEEKLKTIPTSSKSTESLYSSSSSKYSSSGIHRRKTAVSTRQGGFVSTTSEVRQRVMSARRLRMKTLQNQLADAQQHITELANENRILRTLHKRQDLALSKYENTNAELPQLLHSHSEEIRVWQCKYRSLQQQNRELAQKLKQKDSIILQLSDQNKHLTQLSKDKHLEEREKLTERVKYLESLLAEKDNDMKLLARRLQLEAKSFKNQLQSEHYRYKDVINKLEQARGELAVYSSTLEQMENEPAGKCPLVPRSLSGSRMKQIQQKNSNLLVPPNESYHMPIPGTETKNGKAAGARDRSPSPLSGAEENDVLPPNCFRPTVRNMKKTGHLKNKKKENSINELTKAIKKGMSTIESSSDEDESENEHTNLRMLNPVAEEYPTHENEYDENSFEEDDDVIDDRNNDFHNKIGNVMENGENNEEEPSETDDSVRDDIHHIKKQMSEDYQNRETFLDSYCRQQSLDHSVNREEKAISGQAIDPKKKVKLLAALKAIDENQSEEQNVN